MIILSLHDPSHDQWPSVTRMIIGSESGGLWLRPRGPAAADGPQLESRCRVRLGWYRAGQRSAPLVHHSSLVDSVPAMTTCARGVVPANRIRVSPADPTSQTENLNAAEARARVWGHQQDIPRECPLTSRPRAGSRDARIRGGAIRVRCLHWICPARPGPALPNGTTTRHRHSDVCRTSLRARKVNLPTRRTRNSPRQTACRSRRLSESASC